MKYTYTATFTRKDDRSGFLCRVPDLPGCISSGTDLNDAIDMITDAASVWLVTAEDEGLEIAAPSPQSQLRADPDTILSIICVDTIKYRSKIDTRAVRKNVSLPAWMARLADERGINCSQVLQDSLKALFSN